MTIGKLSGQCDFGQKGQSYCNQRGQSCVAKRVKVAWLFQEVVNGSWKKEEQLKELKTELAALDRKIQLSLKPIEEGESQQEGTEMM